MPTEIIPSGITIEAIVMSENGVSIRRMAVR
jgi:hypothetical protein